MTYTNLSNLKNDHFGLYNAIKGRGFDLRSAKVLISKVRAKNGQTVDPEFYVLCKDGILYHLVRIFDYYITEIVEEPNLLHLASKSIANIQNLSNNTKKETTL